MAVMASSSRQLHSESSTNKEVTKTSVFTKPWWTLKWVYVEISCLAVVMVVMWVSLALPVIFFYMPVPGISPLEQPATGNSSEGACLNGSSSMMCADGSANGNITEPVEDEVSIIIPSRPINCSDLFFKVELGNVTICAPQCPAWRQYPAYISILLDRVVLVCSCVGVLSAVGVLLIAFHRRHYIFTFPAVFIVYQTFTLLVLVSFMVINFVDREKLFCTSPNLAASLLKPTSFCIISGVVFYYSLIQITLWWFFHICTLFWTFRFPLHFRSFQNVRRTKYIHLACVFLGLVVPIVPVAVTMGDYATQDRGNPTVVQGLGFGMTNFPPILCAGMDANATFFSLIMPLTIFYEIGMTLLIITFWDVRKHSMHISKNRKKKKCFKIGSGEQKIMIVMVYYVIMLAFALMAFTLATRNVRQFRTAVKLHFICESLGHDEANPCDRTQLEGLKYPGVSLVAYVMLALFPTINFTYVINFRKLKRWFYTRVLKRELSFTANQMNSTTDLRQLSVTTSVAYSVNKRLGPEGSPSGISLTNGDIPIPPS